MLKTRSTEYLSSAGRGYIMLTGSANYKAASEALYNDDRLLDNPGLVASSENYAWGVSFW